MDFNNVTLSGTIISEVSQPKPGSFSPFTFVKINAIKYKASSSFSASVMVRGEDAVRIYANAKVGDKVFIMGHLDLTGKNKSLTVIADSIYIPRMEMQPQTQVQQQNNYGSYPQYPQQTPRPQQNQYDANGYGNGNGNQAWQNNNPNPPQQPIPQPPQPPQSSYPQQNQGVAPYPARTAQTPAQMPPATAYMGQNQMQQQQPIPQPNAQNLSNPNLSTPNAQTNGIPKSVVNDALNVDNFDINSFEDITPDVQEML